jgi:hypothetical protein
VTGGCLRKAQFPEGNYYGSYFSTFYGLFNNSFFSSEFVSGAANDGISNEL